jgi:acyl dehydratase
MDQDTNPDAAARIITVEAPYFEDLKVGQLYTDAPAVTLTSGHAAFHEALFGDRLRLPLDGILCEKVTGSALALVHPNVVCNVAIGQTTSPTQRVKGNLFISRSSSGIPCAHRRRLLPSNKTGRSPDAMPPEWRSSRFT